MSITPQEISDKAFSRTFRGYNQEEVDLFLDKIYFELEEMIRYKDETELIFFHVTILPLKQLMLLPIHTGVLYLDNF